MTNTNKKYDLVILAHPKDYVKISFCLQACLKHLEPKPEEIYLVTPDGISISEDVISIKDSDTINIKAEDIKYRRQNWIFKQLVNLFQDFTTNDLYMSVDSDVIFNNTIRVFENNKLNFFITDRDDHPAGKDDFISRNRAYFHFSRVMHNLDRQTDHTFINDFMLFDKNICRDICDNEVEYLTRCNKVMDEECLLGEYELYGHYVTKYFPDRYDKQYTKTKMFGKSMYNTKPWNAEEINELVAINSDIKDLDLFTIHTWT